VREEHRADDVAVAVHRVDAPDHRDAHATIAGVDGGVVELVRELEPVRRRRTLVVARGGTATGEDRPQVVLLHVFRLDAADVALDDLADFLFDRHLLEQGRNLLFESVVLGERPLRRRPDFRVNRRRIFGLGDGCGLFLGRLFASEHQQERSEHQKRRAMFTDMRHGRGHRKTPVFERRQPMLSAAEIRGFVDRFPVARIASPPRRGG
jgi:hypothetical protein